MKGFKINIPSVQAGMGCVDSLPTCLRRYGKRALLLFGQSEFARSEKRQLLLASLETFGISARQTMLPAGSEASCELIDELAEEFREFAPQVVAALGDGELLDIGKLLSVRLACSSLSVLEENAESVKRLPLVAVPICGDGGEAMSSASLVGNGERTRRVLRSSALLPSLVLVDSELSVSSTLAVTLYGGMETLCRLIESYVSANANPFVDSLLLDALPGVFNALYDICGNGNDSPESRNSLAYGSLIAGIACENTAFGIIDGMAASIGSHSKIPHDALCASLLYAATLKNMQRVQLFAPHSAATERYARIGSVISGIDYEYDKHNVLLRAVSHALLEMREELRVPSLRQLGVDKNDFYEFASNTEQGGNPVKLADSELLEILELSY